MSDSHRGDVPVVLVIMSICAIAAGTVGVLYLLAFGFLLITLVADQVIRAPARNKAIPPRATDVVLGACDVLDSVSS